MGAALLAVVGVWVVCQVTKGDALNRLAITTSAGSKPATTTPGTAPAVPGPGQPMPGTGGTGGGTGGGTSW